MNLLTHYIDFFSNRHFLFKSSFMKKLKHEYIEIRINHSLFKTIVFHFYLIFARKIIRYLIKN